MVENRNRWLVCLSTVVGGISLALVQNKISPIITILMANFKINAQTAGWLSSIFSLIGVFVALPASSIIKRIGVKKAGLASLVIAIIGSLMGVLTNNVVILMFSRFIEGMGVGIISVLGPMVITMWFKPEERGLPMTIWTSWMTISQAILFFSASPLVKHFTWRGLWWLGIIACAISIVLYSMFVSEPHKVEPQNVTSDRQDIVQGVKSLSTWIMALAAFLFTLCSFTFVSWIGNSWARNANIPLNHVTPLIGYVYLFEIVYMVIIGFVLDRIPNKKLFGLVAAVIYGIIGLISFNFTKSYAMIWVMIVLFPFFDGSLPSVIYTLAPLTEKDSRYSPQAISIMNIGLNAGTFLAAPLSGALVDINVNLVGYCFLIVAVCVGICIAGFKIYDSKN
ncbi:MAG: MFS transporter [Bombilactobacillus mellifer]|nr:MFS transporter [Bombilactobacillus mellifer]